MITSPQIEKYAFQGKCRWAVQWYGIGTAGTIECPPGGFILLRQIMYNPFNQQNDSSEHSGNVHQMTLTEQGSSDELQYIFRDPNDGAARNPTPLNSQQIIETWGVFKRNVEIDMINVGKAANFTYAAGAPFLPDAQERPVPMGFGTSPAGLNVDPTITIGTAAEKYFPAGQKRPISGALYGGTGVRDRLRWDVISGRQISPATNDFSYPMVGFGMWIFNIPVSEYLNY